MKFVYYMLVGIFLLPAVLVWHTPTQAQENVLPDTATTTTASTSSPTTHELSQSTQYKALPRIILNERAQTRIINLSANMSNRMDATSARLDQISGRLQNRLFKLGAEGFNTNEAEVELARAKSFIAESEARLRTIDEEVQRAVFSENPQITVRQLQDSFRSIATDLKNADQSLRITLSLSQSAQRSITETATTSTIEIFD